MNRVVNVVCLFVCFCGVRLVPVDWIFPSKSMNVVGDFSSVSLLETMWRIEWSSPRNCKDHLLALQS